MTNDIAERFRSTGRHSRPGAEPLIQRMAVLALREAEDPEGPTITELRALMRGVRTELDSAVDGVSQALFQEWDQAKAQRAVAGLITLMGHLQGSVPNDPEK